MGRTDRKQVHTKAQVRERFSHLLILYLIHGKVACSHTAVTSTGAPHAPSASALTLVPYLTRVKVEEGQCPYTPSSPRTLIYRISLASVSQKRPTAGSCSATTTTPAPPAPGASESVEARTQKSSSNTVTLAIQQSSSEFAGPCGSIQPPIVQDRPENVPLTPSGIPPQLLVPPLSHSPHQSTRTDPSPNAIDVAAPMVSSERQKETTPLSSNSLPPPEEKKVSPIRGQTNIKRSTRASVTQKPSTKFTPFSLTPNEPRPPGTRREAPSRLTMPGAFPGTLLDDVDMSSWVLVSPVNPDCRVEVSKRSWFKRMFSRFG